MVEGEDEILTVDEAAQLLKVNPQVIRKWANAGTIPAGRLGNRRWRFRKQELIDWLFERGAGRQKQTAKRSSATRKRGRSDAD